MIHIFSSNFLTRKPIEHAVQTFSRRFTAAHTVLDIGCGNKPYAQYFSCKYVGLDPFPEAKADIIRDAWDSGLPDNSVDGILLNQSLEHIPRTTETIAEVMRILKPGGLILVTVPQTMRHHTTPIPATTVPYKNFNVKDIPFWNEDYFRFTKFGLIYLFRDFEIIRLTPNQSYLSTLLQLWNYFLASFDMGILFSPLFCINNLLAILLDYLSSLFGKISVRYKALIHEGLTIDHLLIARKHTKQTRL